MGGDNVPPPSPPAGDGPASEHEQNIYENRFSKCMSDNLNTNQQS